MENLWPLALLAVPLFAALPVLFSGWIVIAAFVLLLAAETLAIWLLAKRSARGAVPLAVSGLIAAICVVARDCGRRRRYLHRRGLRSGLSAHAAFSEIDSRHMKGVMPAFGPSQKPKRLPC